MLSSAYFLATASVEFPPASVAAKQNLLMRQFYASFGEDSLLTW